MIIRYFTPILRIAKQNHSYLINTAFDSINLAKVTKETAVKLYGVLDV